MNLNLITDEEVFFGLLDDPRVNSNRAFITPYGGRPATTRRATTAYYLPLRRQRADLAGRRRRASPAIATAIYANGMPSYTIPAVTPVTMTPQRRRHAPRLPERRGRHRTSQMKAAFADFLKLRDGGSGLVYSPFSRRPRRSGATRPTRTPHASAVPVAAPSRSARWPARDINDTVMRPARLPAFQTSTRRCRTDRPGQRRYPTSAIHPDWPRRGPRPGGCSRSPTPTPTRHLRTFRRPDLASRRNSGTRHLARQPKSAHPASRRRRRRPHLPDAARTPACSPSTVDTGDPAAMRLSSAAARTALGSGPPPSRPSPTTAGTRRIAPRCSRRS